MRYEKQLTKRVTQITEHTDCCRCETFTFDGVKVLQAYQGFFYTSNGPIYSSINKYGDHTEIIKDEFKRALDHILSL